MKASLIPLAVASAVTATSVVAQERIRSSGYNGGAVQGCYSWAVPFEYTSCERKVVSGSLTDFAQVYTLPDGSVRRLTKNPSLETASVNQRPTTPLVSDRTASDLSNSPVAEQRPQQAALAAPGTRTIDRQVVTTRDTGQSRQASTSSIVEEKFVLPSRVDTTPGKAEIMAVAVGHLNRLKTPFKQPAIRTSAPSDALNVEFDGSYVYVSVTQPATLFIHESGHPDPAIVLSLVPKRIAPRQVEINLPASTLAQVQSNAAVRPSPVRNRSQGVTRRSAANPAMNPMAKILQTAIKGRTPRGFKRIDTAGFKASDFCSQAGVVFSLEQGLVLQSRDYVLVRGMAKSSSARDLKEIRCTRNKDTVAVAFAPRIAVGPASPVDFFVLLRSPTNPILTVK